jgi:hypothetical protein
MMTRAGPVAGRRSRPPKPAAEAGRGTRAREAPSQGRREVLRGDDVPNTEGGWPEAGADRGREVGRMGKSRPGRGAGLGSDS